MKFFTLVASAAAVSAVSFQGGFDDTIRKINGNTDLTWKAENPSRFGSLEEVKKLCGTRLKNHPDYKHVELKDGAQFLPKSMDIPAAFDTRTAFGNCSAVIAKVRDQSSCGSCWAFSATEAFEGSRCVANKKAIEYSPQDTAGCCKGFACGMSQGCNGGQPGAALNWMTKTGVVTGGDYKSNDGCKPYELQPCAHHVPPSSQYPQCPSSEYSVRCEKSCDSTSIDYESDKTKGSDAFSLYSVDAMQKALMTYGPLSAAFTVYSDFPTYKSGVYKHTTGEALGGHAILIVGWGSENGEDYWIVKNSWNEQWGNGGYFWIARGSDECGIEDMVTGIKFA